MKKILKFSILIITINLCFLFSPRPIENEEQFCGDYVALGKSAGFIINCDAYDFVKCSRIPSLLATKNYVRQSRPLYVIAASGIGYAFYYVSDVFRSIHEFTSSECIYLGYIALNFIILLMALILFDRIARILTNGQITDTVVLLLSVFMVSNFITKAFFWTAHQQMFTFLMPLLSIYICMNVITYLTRIRLYLLFLLIGSGMLIYGSFLVLFVACLLYLCYILYTEKRLFTFNSASLIVLTTILFFLPTMIWVSYLNYKGVGYYSHEVVKYRQIVWMLDALKVSVGYFISEFYKNFIEFVPTMSKLCLFILFFILTIFYNKAKNGIAFVLDKNVGLILFNLFCFGSFLLVLGFNDNRLTFTLVPIILCLIVANLGTMLNHKMNQLVLFAVVCIWHVVNVLSYGPFS